MDKQQNIERNYSTFLKKGNKALRDRNYTDAVSNYINTLYNTPALSRIISNNLKILRLRYSRESRTREYKHIAVCCCDPANESNIRIHTLAKLYESYSEVEIIACLFSSFNKNLYELKINENININYFKIEDESVFIEKVVKIVTSNPYEIVHLCNPHMPGIIIGIIYKLIWGTKVLIDIDDEENLNLAPESGISVEDYVNKYGNLPELLDLFQNDWTCLAIGLFKHFDGITVINQKVKEKFDGVIIPNEETKASEREYLESSRLSEVIDLTIDVYPEYKLFSSLLSNIDSLRIFNQLNDAKHSDGISIIILNHNGARYLDKLLTTFFQKNTYNPVEIIIVDHNSTDDTNEVIERNKHKGDIKQIKRDKNYTFSESCNYAAGKATFTYLLFINNDVVYTNDVLPIAINKITENIGVIGVRLDDYPSTLPGVINQKIQHRGIEFKWNAKRGYYQPEQIRHNCISEDTKQNIYCPAVTGAFLLCRKDDFEKVNGFSEDYDYGLEDIDLCLRIGRDLEKRSFCINEVGLQHIDGATRKIGSQQKRLEKIERNHVIFKQRWSEYILSMIKKKNVVESTAEQIDQFIIEEKYYDDLTPESNGTSSLKTIAFYLPQFHQIPENDEWWGYGFTDWDNTKKARPLFSGHSQPRKPNHLGYYNLENSNVYEKQVQLAKNVGVYGFCFYFYWFNGKTLLEKPLRNILENPDIDFPFCLCWANENWTRRWDGLDNEILISQSYSEKDSINFLNYIKDYLFDDRYIKVNGKPVVVIYRPSLIPNIYNIQKIWRRQSREIGLEGLYLVVVQSIEEMNPIDIGFDAAVEFPPLKRHLKADLKLGKELLSNSFKGNIRDYNILAKDFSNRENPEYKLFKGVTLAWDNSARRGNTSNIYKNFSLNRFGQWLFSAYQCVLNNSRLNDSEKFVFINAWNEWAEGTYLEPDTKYGFGYLQVVKEVNKVISYQDKKVSVVVPNYNSEEFIEKRLNTIIRQKVNPYEIIFLDDASTDNSLEIARKILSKSGLRYSIITNEYNSNSVFKQWIKGIDNSEGDLIWIAECDDSASEDFLRIILPVFEREDVLLAYGNIDYIDKNNNLITGLETYYDDLNNFNWNKNIDIAAYKAFTDDFAVKNVIPNVSGAIFRKPILSNKERQRLELYKFAGDWYFYSLITRGGTISYRKDAKSYFRLNKNGVSQNTFFTASHLKDHKMILKDLNTIYNLPVKTIDRHLDELNKVLNLSAKKYKQKVTKENLVLEFNNNIPLRICIASYGFSIGGGEIVPIDIANNLRNRGHTVTFLSLKKNLLKADFGLKNRLRKDIPVFYIDDIKGEINSFLTDYGINIFNSHNIGFEYKLKDSKINVVYISTLHGGYETRKEFLSEKKFVSFVKNTVNKWMYLSSKNIRPLLNLGIDKTKFTRYINAVSDQSTVSKLDSGIRKAINANDESILLVLASRAIKEKGWESAISITTKLREDHHIDYRLVLLGDGPDYEEIAQQNKNIIYVHFMGRIFNSMNIISKCDIGIFPSTFSGESYPLFVIECLKKGLPVFTTDVGNVRSIMRTTNGKIPGVVFSISQNTKNLVNTIADSIDLLITNTKRYNYVKKWAYEAGKRFNIEKVVDKYESVFRKQVYENLDRLTNRNLEYFFSSETNFLEEQTNTSFSNNNIQKEVEIIKNSDYFNEQYYLNCNKDLRGLTLDPVRHYCEYGWREGRNPSVMFDTIDYLEVNMDINMAGINPLYHYIKSGYIEGRSPSKFNNSSYEEKYRFGKITSDIKPIAFYLPQFHEIPENNEWWGKGFTEWHNTRKAKPLIEGHYQPREPHNDIGYYDLSNWQVIKKQANIAKEHGIYGFCFYHYWFAGKRLLEKPVDLFLNHRGIDFPFCLCWANENWTRRWDGYDNEVLIEQNHSPKDNIEFIDNITKYLQDERYIKIDGKPVILVYRPSLLPNAKETTERWRKRLKNNGIGDVYLICPYGAFDDNTVPFEYGFDAAVEFPPNILEPWQRRFQTISIGEEKKGNAYRYSDFIDDVLKKRKLLKKKSFDLFYSVMLEWDNSPRRKDGPTIFTNYSSLDYRYWLDKTIEITRKEHKEDSRFIFINAWNEWAEGTYLEPDKKYGYLSLNETSRALCNIRQGRKLPKVTVIVPNYNHAPFLRKRLDSVYHQTYKNIEVILLDDCSTDKSRVILEEYAEKYSDITKKIYNKKNSGGVFRQWAKGIKHASGTLVWIAESDDFCDENFLDVLVQSFADEAVLLSYSYSKFVGKDGKPFAEGGFEYYVSQIDSKKWEKSYVETSHNEVREALGIINTIPNASSVVFRKPYDLWLLDDEEWLSMSVAGDWVFYLHIIHGGKIAYNNQTTNYFRLYAGSAAETTYKCEKFYREVGKANRTIASLYNVHLDVLEKSRSYYMKFYKDNVGNDVKKFEEWFNFEQVIKEKDNRYKNVMVSLFSFYSGGAEIIAIRIANELKKQGLAVVLHSSNVLPRNNGIRGMVRNDIPVVETNDTNELKKTIEDFGIDVLNSHHWHIQRYSLFDKDVFKGVPLHVATLHGMIEAENGYNVTADQLHVVEKHVDKWIYTAEKNIEPFKKAKLYKKNSSSFLKIPNGLEPPKIVAVNMSDLGISEDSFVLCTVSRAIPEKGWSETIEAVGIARKLTGKDIRLILIGNGPVYEDYCRRGVPDFVFMPGFDDNSVGYYAAADMGIMLTRFQSESFPLTILDCLFAGKPYIASDIGEIKNILTIDNKLAGAVFELDEWNIPVERVAEIIKEFIVDKEKYIRAKNIVSRIKGRYTIEAVAKKYLEVFYNNENKIKDVK